MDGQVADGNGPKGGTLSQTVGASTGSADQTIAMMRHGGVPSEATLAGIVKAMEGGFLGDEDRRFVMGWIAGRAGGSPPASPAGESACEATDPPALQWVRHGPGEPPEPGLYLRYSRRDPRGDSGGFIGAFWRCAGDCPPDTREGWGWLYGPVPPPPTRA